MRRLRGLQKWHRAASSHGCGRGGPSVEVNYGAAPNLQLRLIELLPV